MDTRHVDTLTPSQSNSYLERFLASKQPSLAAVALGFMTLIVAIGLFESFGPWATALQTARRFHPNLIWPMMAALGMLWPLTTLVTHLVARFAKLQAPFLRALQITGKAWILHVLVILMVDLTVVGLVSIGWIALAQFWYIAARGGIIWIIYPKTISSIYGSNARSCLMAILIWVIAIPFVIVAALLIIQVANR